MNARDFALVLLDKKWLPGWKQNLVREKKPRVPLDPRDRALAEQIVNGVVKNLRLLQEAIEHYSGKSPANVDPVVQKILAIALYQLKFLDRIPASAAVDEAVKQTKRFGQRRASGFVNAVLRNFERQPGPAVPDASADPEGYAELALSHPPELFRRLVELLGDERALAFCRHDNAEPPTILRLFKGIERAALIEEWERLRDRWKAKGMPELPAVEIGPHELPGLLVVRGARGGDSGPLGKVGVGTGSGCDGGAGHRENADNSRLACSGPLRWIGNQDDADSGKDRRRRRGFCDGFIHLPDGRVAAITAGPRYHKRPGRSRLRTFRNRGRRFRIPLIAFWSMFPAATAASWRGGPKPAIDLRSTAWPMSSGKSSMIRFPGWLAAGS